VRFRLVRLPDLFVRRRFVFAQTPPAHSVRPSAPRFNPGTSGAGREAIRAMLCHL